MLKNPRRPSEERGRAPVYFRLYATETPKAAEWNLGCAEASGSAYESAIPRSGIALHINRT